MQHLSFPASGLPLSRREKLPRAFTLVEMLVVLGVIVLLLGLLIPAASSMLRGSNLTQSGNLVGDQLTLARQAAMASNRRVQVRFYQLPIATVNGATSYCAMQTFRLEESGTTTPLNKIQNLSPGVIFANNITYSTLIAPPVTVTPSVTGTTTLATYGNQACPYVGFQFLPDGSTDLDPTAASTYGGWFVTLVASNTLTPATGQPANFCTVRVDPINGRVQTFRP